MPTGPRGRVVHQERPVTQQRLDARPFAASGYSRSEVAPGLEAHRLSPPRLLQHGASAEHTLPRALAFCADRGHGCGHALPQLLEHVEARIAIACLDTGIRVLDLATGKQLTKLGTTSAATGVAWSPSGDRLATRDGTGKIRVWRGAEVAAAIEPETEGALWWQSADELGGTEHGLVMSWTIADRAPHPRKPKLEGRAAHSPHGELVLAHRTYRDTDEVAVVRGGKPAPVELPETKHDWIDALAIDDAGAHTVPTRGEYNGQPALELIEIDVAAANAKLTELTTPAAAIGDGGAIAVASKTGSVTVRSGGQSKTLGEVPGGVTTLAISHGVVTAGGRDGSISLWAADGAALGKLAGHTAPIRALAFAPDGLHLASTASDGTRTWDLTP